MGSELDVDQSLNLRNLFQYKYNDCVGLAGKIVTDAIQNAVETVTEKRENLDSSDSGTDSFSEQMVY